MNPMRDVTAALGAAGVPGHSTDDTNHQAAPTPLEKLEAATYDLAGIEAIPPPEYLIADALVRDTLTTTYGPPGHGKSFVALGQGLAVAHGIPWMGRDVQPGPVVYVVAEGSAGAGQRVAAWREHHHHPDPTHPISFLARPVNLLNSEWSTALLEYCAARSPVLIVIDTLARCSVGANENDARDMGIIVDNADRLRRVTGACVNVIHHSGKELGRKGRGSNALEGAVDTEIEVVAAANTTTLRWTKCKDSAEPQPLTLERKVVGTSCVLVTTDTDSPGHTVLTSGAMQTLAALRAIEVPGGITATLWRDQAADEGIAKSTFFLHRKQLTDSDLVVNIGTDKQPRYLTRITHEQDRTE